MKENKEENQTQGHAEFVKEQEALKHLKDIEQQYGPVHPRYIIAKKSYEQCLKDYLEAV